MKNVKQAFLHSVIALILCASMLVGTTFAWFTDSVTTGVNVIQSGKLDVELYWTDDLESGNWKDASTGAIFDYDKWEPGYADIAYLKIVNAGNLALQYQLTLVPDGEIGKLAEVLDVYYIENPTKNVASRDDLTDSVGKLTDVMNGQVSTSGALIPAEKAANDPTYSSEKIVAVALKMPTTAGNEYQNRTAGAFRVQVVATQFAYESDMEDDTYDAEALFPLLSLPATGSVTVTPTADNKVPAGGVNITVKDQISVTIPEGVQLKDGVSTLTLTVSEVLESKSNVTLGDTEVMRALDVHVEGVAENNTVPLTVTIPEALPIGLNLGNYSFYHVEGGQTNAMTLVASAADFTAHNQFTYDPTTGDVSLYMATFSEVAAVSDTVNPWNGTFDTDWYNTTDTEFKIANADELAGFGQIVGGMAEGIERDSFAGKTVTLISDVNLGDAESENNADLIFYPIGYYNSLGYEKTAGGTVESTVYSFEGVFDGNGHTVKNFYQNTWEMFGDYNRYYTGTPNHYNDAMGLFGYVVGGDPETDGHNVAAIKNLTVENFSCDGEFAPTGVITAYAKGDVVFENIALTNCNPRTYNTGVAGIVGWDDGGDDDSSAENTHYTFKNITIDNSNKISALWGSWDVAAGGLMGYLGPKSTVNMANCHVAAQIDVYNDVCGNYQYYWYRYSGMLIGTIDRHTTDDNGYTIPDTTGITAEGCTVHFGEWNNYWYCELVANSIASYTHDHQFSRLTQVDSVDVVNMTVEVDGKTTDIPSSGRYNYVVATGNSTGAATCYHFVDGTQYTHDKAGTEEVNGETVSVEDKQHVYLPFNQLFTGYGWGVKNIPIYDDESSNVFGGVTILDREVADSVVKFETKLTDDFLYRVGNENPVTLSYLFSEITSNSVNDSSVYVTIDKVDKDMTVSGVYTPSTTDNWEDGTIQFTGTGVVKVTIQDYIYCTPTILYLEVVNATNVTTYSGLGNKNSVLLNDITMSSGGRYYLTGATLYGNGFTFNVESASNLIAAIELNGATVDNTVVIGAVYENYSGVYNTSNFASTIRTTGSVTSKITNSYVSGGSVPLRAYTSAELVNTTLYGGTLGNVDIRGGELTLTDVTTYNQADDRPVVGLGIVVNTSADEKTNIYINGTLHQYNYISSEDEDKASATEANTIYSEIFNKTTYDDYKFTEGSVTYVNTGILSLSESVGSVQIIDNRTDKQNYFGTAATLMGVNGYLYSIKADGGTMDRNYVETGRAQGDYLPTLKFDLGDQEISYDGEDDDRYCYEDSGVVKVLYKENDAPVTLDLTNLATVYKYNDIYYDVSSVCKDFSGNALTSDNGVVTLSSAGNYTIEFTVDDNIFYGKDGKMISKSIPRTYTKSVVVSVEKADIKDAVITVKDSDGIFVEGGNVLDKDWYYRINITDSVSVTDFSADDTVGTAVDWTDFTECSFSGARSGGTATFSDGNGRTLTVTVGSLTATGFNPTTVTAGNDSGVLYIVTDGVSDDKSSCEWPITSVTFTGNSGKPVTNSDGAKATWTAESSSSGGGCVTPDTLVTLADGSQKRIDEVTYDDQLLVWDFYKGEYAVVPSAIIFDHGYGNNVVIALTFSDGTVVKVVNLHQFLDADLNQFVTIDPDSVSQYVGHQFVKQSGDGYSTVTLVDYSVSEEYIEAYGIISAGYYNILVEGMFSTDFMPKDYDLFNYFQIGDDMKYDADQMQKDIKTYGLYTYEEFADYLTYEQFVAFNVQYFKIPVGKGDYTFEGILGLIEEYLMQ